MPTDLADLRGSLDVEIRAGLTDPQMDELLVAGVDLYNAEAPREFTVDNTELDRNATAVERRALVLFSVLAYLNGESVRASRNAVAISNPAGKTDLSSVEWALGKRRKELVEGPLKKVMDRLTSGGVMEEVHAEELGETKDLSTVPAQYPYGF